MRDDENYAKEQFSNFLESKTIEDFEWFDGDEPPDFYLDISNLRFAVEVTRLVDNIETQRGIKPRNTIDSSAEKLVEKINQESQKTKILDGRYIISFSPVQHDFYPVRRQIESKILNFIKLNQHNRESIKEDIIIDSIDYCSILKTLVRKPEVIIGTYPSSAKFVSVALDDACKNLELAIENKQNRMKNILDMPKILLLLNESHYITTGQYLSCIDVISKNIFFHTICMISTWNQQLDCILYTTNDNWR